MRSLCAHCVIVFILVFMLLVYICLVYLCVDLFRISLLHVLSSLFFFLQLSLLFLFLNQNLKACSKTLLSF
jgi:hypothetical protein